MINYGEDISDRDIINYWGTGFVLHPTEDGWASYQLVNAEEGLCTLKRTALDLKVQQAASPVIHMPRERFFEEVLLHRPSLGVVEDIKSQQLVMLSWAPPKGNLTKAIHVHDIYEQAVCALKLPEDMEMPPPAKLILDNSGEGLVAKFLANQLAYNGEYHPIDLLRTLQESRVYRPNINTRNLMLDEGQVDDRNEAKLVLLLELLNRPAISFDDALTRCHKQECCPLKDDWWIRKSRHSVGMYTIYSGRIEVGDIRVRHPNKASIHIQQSDRLDKESISARIGLLTRMLRGYNITIEENGNDD